MNGSGPRECGIATRIAFDMPLLLLVLVVVLLLYMDLGSSSLGRAVFLLALIIGTIGGRGGWKQAVRVSLRGEAGRSLDAAVVVDNARVTEGIAMLRRLGGLSDGTEAARTLA